jgi:hypothetical protein
LTVRLNDSVPVVILPLGGHLGSEEVKEPEYLIVLFVPAVPVNDTESVPLVNLQRFVPKTVPPVSVMIEPVVVSLRPVMFGSVPVNETSVSGTVLSIVPL